MRKMSAVLLPFVALALFIACRVPLLEKTLVGEEGNFAMLLVGTAQSPTTSIIEADNQNLDQCLMTMAQIDGSSTLVRPGKNLIPYCLIGIPYQYFYSYFDLSKQSFDHKTTIARASYFGIALLGYMLILLICYQISNMLSLAYRLIPYLIFLYGTTSIVSVGSSIQPQLDGSVGVLFFCTSFYLTYLAANKATQDLMQYCLLLSAGLIISLGKIEWTISFILSLGLASITVLTINLLKNNNYLNSIKMIIKLRTLVAPLFLGAILGSYLSYIFSSQDYLYAIDVMSSVANQKYSSWNLIVLFQDLLRPIAILYTVAIIMTILNFKDFFLKESFFIGGIYFLFSAIVIFGFIYGAWIGDAFPRHYAPSTIIVTVYIILLMPSTASKLPMYTKILVIAFLVWGLLKNIAILDVYRKTSISITAPGDTNWLKNNLVSTKKLSESNPDKVYFTDPSINYYFKGTNFISKDYGPEGAQDLMKNYKNKILVIE
jgi:hypothetical protein